MPAKGQDLLFQIDRQQQWEKDWPHYCKHCGGFGQYTWTEYHDGHQYPGETMTEPCDHCLAQGKCPRCAASMPDDAEECPSCEWNESNPDGLPYVDEEPGDYDE